MKRGESLSPSLFTFRSHFATMHNHQYYVFMTALECMVERCIAAAAGPLSRNHIEAGALAVREMCQNPICFGHWG
jgi:hypothetical protein